MAELAVAGHAYRAGVKIAALPASGAVRLILRLVLSLSRPGIGKALR